MGLFQLICDFEPEFIKIDWEDLIINPMFYSFNKLPELEKKLRNPIIIKTI